ncbi:MAG: DUF86 domain-containing protein [Atribacterota bacterium]|nr:DUF86 domain-containing protein [Atribacterota bacterium]
MSKSELLITILYQINEALLTISQRFKPVSSVSYLTDSPEGKEKLDALCMQLIAVGESLKKVDKLTDKKLLTQYPQVDWTGAKGVRDIISHHYFDIDADEIFWICDNQIEPMQKTIEQIIKSIERD